MTPRVDIAPHSVPPCDIAPHSAPPCSATHHRTAIAPYLAPLEPDLTTPPPLVSPPTALRPPPSTPPPPPQAAMAKNLGGEVVNVGRVVGAEKERAALETVIIRRAKLLGEDPELKLAESGFGGQMGGKATAMGGHANKRFATKSEGLKIKGKVRSDAERNPHRPMCRLPTLVTCAPRQTPPHNLTPPPSPHRQSRWWRTGPSKCPALRRGPMQCASVHAPGYALWRFRCSSIGSSAGASAPRERAVWSVLVARSRARTWRCSAAWWARGGRGEHSTKEDTRTLKFKKTNIFSSLSLR